MNRRLDTIYHMIRPGRGVIDVGTDHGYLPARLAAENYAGELIASDIRSGPLAAARRTAELAGVEERIHFVLADGLDACPPDAVDTIVIAGMGGDTICGILDRAEWCMDPAYCMILQPMTKAEILRYWLTNNGLSICSEVLIEDAGVLYQILEARFTGINEKLCDTELLIGKQGLADPDLYQRALQRQICATERRIEGLLAASDRGSRELSSQRRLLAEMKQMRNDIYDKGL